LILAEVDKYIADPWCGFMVTTQFWVDMLAGLRYIEDPANQAKIKKSLPVYIFSGARDPVGGETKGLRQLLEAYGAAGLTNVTHRFYPEGRHEMFNETNREEVLQDLGDWVETVIG
jgi:alpha-beta hydrolase superfamily lysophospholipase